MSWGWQQERVLIQVVGGVSFRMTVSKEPVLTVGGSGRIWPDGALLPALEGRGAQCCDLCRVYDNEWLGS